MTTVASPVKIRTITKSNNENPNNGFLKFLPAVTTHASIAFRHLREADREEAIAEAVAAAFLNFASARRRGKLGVVKSSMLANYAVLHARSGKHVGGTDAKHDVLNFKAQKAGGFVVHHLAWDDSHVYDVLRAPEVVWRAVLLEDKNTPVPEQARFRVDFSSFMAKQQDRTRKAIALLAAGHNRSQVADMLGVTPSAVTQRMAKAEREWAAFQAEEFDRPRRVKADSVLRRPGRRHRTPLVSTGPRPAA